ncbi:hypothetical protein B0J11DRAFT_187320 [Dendryphion nanum]|uniref:Zn(2)-C6 fungal-type domain-containing protein n=1 Tax=Dendryphion nanum TaxID=256645 RepID=A0A9P9D3M7_9PLEO|nr:hypothetical protein B0J11DRAFT_187320 [Dendryphion nanum]
MSGRPHYACDRCRQLREKCKFPTSVEPLASCDRCRHSGQLCTMSARGKGGRPRRSDLLSTAAEPGKEFTWQQCYQPAKHNAMANQIPAHMSDSLLRSVAPGDMPLLETMFRRRAFVHSFILHPSFADGMLSQLSSALYYATDTLLSTYFAVSGHFSAKIEGTLPNHDSNLDYTHSARAVETLRIVGQEQHSKTIDIPTILTLGLGMVTFDLWKTGRHAHSICRFTLALATERRASALYAMAGEKELLAPLHFMDIINCIIRRGSPIPLPSTGIPVGLDKYIGICIPLLAHMANISQISHDLARTGTDVEISHHQLDNIQTRLLAWNPAEDHSIILDATQIRTILLQAAILRRATLLVLHRIKYALGMQDYLATLEAQRILDDIDELYRYAIAEIPSCCDVLENPFEYRLSFPLLVAGIEVCGRRERTRLLSRLSRVACPQRYPAPNVMIANFLKYVWQKRDAGDDGFWLDWTLKGPLVVLF